MLAQDLTPELILPYLVRLMIIFLINPLHECAHALAAHKLGDDTAKNAGRLTLDPIAHLDPFGAIFLLLFRFGWAKPVPVNPANFKHKNLDMMLVAIAGPLSNLIAALIGMIAFQMCGGFEGFSSRSLFYVDPDGSSEGYFFYLLYELIDINLVLFLFNLLPVPPLDGSRVLNYFLPPKAAVWYMKHSRIFYGIMFILMLIGVLNIPILYGRIYIARGMAWLVQFLPVVAH